MFSSDENNDQFVFFPKRRREGGSLDKLFNFQIQFYSNNSQLRESYAHMVTHTTTNSGSNRPTVVAQRDLAEEDGLKSVFLGAAVGDGVVSLELAVSLDSTGSLSGIVDGVGSAFLCLEGATDGGIVIVQQVSLASP
jgi:hypothetical protein